MQLLHHPLSTGNCLGHNQFSAVVTLTTRPSYADCDGCLDFANDLQVDTVKEGECFRVETQDWTGGQIKDDDSAEDMKNINLSLVSLQC